VIFYTGMHFSNYLFVNFWVSSVQFVQLIPEQLQLGGILNKLIATLYAHHPTDKICFPFIGDTKAMRHFMGYREWLFEIMQGRVDITLAGKREINSQDSHSP